MKEKENKYSEGFLTIAHLGCTSNRNELESSRLCACFHCLETFIHKEISEWINDKDGETAICPRCGIDSVLSSRLPIDDKAFLSAMNRMWF